MDLYIGPWLGPIYRTFVPDKSNTSARHPRTLSPTSSTAEVARAQLALLVGFGLGGGGGRRGGGSRDIHSRGRRGGGGGGGAEGTVEWTLTFTPNN